MKYAIYLMIGLGFFSAVSVVNERLPEQCRIPVGIDEAIAIVFGWPGVVAGLTSLYVIDIPSRETECDAIIEQMRKSATNDQ